MKPVHVLALFAFLGCTFGAELDPNSLKEKVTISIGEKLYVSFSLQGDSLSKPVASEVKPAEGLTLPLRLENSDGQVMLISKNPFSKSLHFRALARLKSQKEYFETSILPIPPGLASYESWGDPVEQLVLFDFSLSDEE